MKNLKTLQASLSKQDIIDALKAKVLKGGNIGTCPPPWGIMN